MCSLPPADVPVRDPRTIFITKKPEWGLEDLVLDGKIFWESTKDTGPVSLS